MRKNLCSHIGVAQAENGPSKVGLPTYVRSPRFKQATMETSFSTFLMNFLTPLLNFLSHLSVRFRAAVMPFVAVFLNLFRALTPVWTAFMNFLTFVFRPIHNKYTNVYSFEVLLTKLTTTYMKKIDKIWRNPFCFSYLYAVSVVPFFFRSVNDILEWPVMRNDAQENIRRQRTLSE